MSGSLRSESPCITAALRAASRRLSLLYDEVMAPSGLRLTQFSLLAELERRDAFPATVGELAEIMTMERSALGQTLKPLERDELICACPRGTGRPSSPRASDIRRASGRRPRAAILDGSASQLCRRLRRTGDGGIARDVTRHRREPAGRKRSIGATSQAEALSIFLRARRGVA